tara:strand:- start:6454 stop:7179 length:726 start_codon:yes stop_codon:yes gene_type:complete
MINIDTVYQKVLVLANKEKRGYITPQEFNLLADHAQNEIFDSYFHSIKTSFQSPIKNTGLSTNEMDIVRQKLQPFFSTVATTVNAINGGFFISDEEYRYVESLWKNTGGWQSTGVKCERVMVNELHNILNNPLTAPTHDRPIFVGIGSSYTLYPIPLSGENNFTAAVYSRPKTPVWAYVVVKGKPMYNNASQYSQDFELHASEEENLVMRILALAGVVIQKPGIVEIGLADKASKKQEQNS